jgi:hypothetical protein
VLVAAAVASDGRHVQSALVSEGRQPDVGRVTVRLAVGGFVEVTRDLDELAKLLVGHAAVAELELKVRDDGAQVGVAAALAEAVHGALHLHGAGLDARQRVGHAEPGVVVTVDAEIGAGRERGDHAFTDLLGQRAAARVAQAQQIGTGLGGGLQTGQRVLGIGPVPVEEVLGVEDEPVDLLLQIANRLVDQIEVLLGRDPKRLDGVRLPRLGDDGDDRRLGGEQRLDVLVARRRSSRSGSRAEGGDLGVTKRELLGRLEECCVARVRSRPAALDATHAELVEAFGDGELVAQREAHAFPLAPVA